MKNMKKWLALALACMMMLTAFIIVPISANDDASVEVLDQNNLSINLNTNQLYLAYGVKATVPAGATLEVAFYADEAATQKIADATANGEKKGDYDVYVTPAINVINIDSVFYIKAEVKNGDDVLATSNVFGSSVAEYIARREANPEVNAAEIALFDAIEAYAEAAKAFKQYVDGLNNQPETPVEPEETIVTNAADALAAEPGTKVVITGTVSGIYQAFNSQYGNVSVYIKDDTGTILAFRLVAEDATSWVVGDVITVTGEIVFYADGNTNQIAQGATAEMVTRHNCADYASAESCTMDQTCNSCNAVLKEAEGHTEPNAEGKCDKCGAILETSGEIGEGNLHTFDVESLTTSTANTNSYGTRTSADGWKSTGSRLDANAALATDGAPVTLTGVAKTSNEKGTLVSPTLTGGVQKVSFNYGFAYSDTQLKLTVNIIQDGEVVATTVIDRTGMSKGTIYTFEWELDVPVVGEFSFEIVNEAKTSGTNKDRVAIWNFAWVDTLPAAE